MNGRRRKKIKKKQCQTKHLNNTSPFHLDISWKRNLEYTTILVTPPLLCGQSEQDGTGKNLPGYRQQDYIIAGTTLCKHLNESINLLTESSAFFRFLFTTPDAGCPAGFETEFSLNHFSFSHSCCSSGLALLCENRESTFTSPFPQALLVLSIMNAFLTNTPDKLHMILQVGKASPDTSSSHICLFCTQCY